MKRLVLLLMLIVGAIEFPAAQERSVSGVVTDAASNHPLPQANVQIKGSTTGTVTDNEGRFTLRVPGSETVLVFFYTGYQSKEVVVGAQSVINVSLGEANEEIDQVVVVGYGTARKTGSTVGNIASVGSEVMEAKPIANPLEALGGKVAGMCVLTGSGEPSATASITIHGNGSLGAGSAPLYILDGLPVHSGVILAMNPNDFAQVDVLKDASATSIYGSRAANGVIFITTKRGKKGEHGHVSVRFSYGWSSLANKNYYNKRMSSDQLLAFRKELGHMNDAEIAEIKKEHGDTDFSWVDYFFKQNVPTHQGDVVFSGATKMVDYYISSGYMMSEGMRPNSHYDKYNLRTNVNARIVDWLRIGVNSTLYYDKTQTNNYKVTSRVARPQSMLPWLTPYDSTGKEGDTYMYLGKPNVTIKYDREKAWAYSSTVSLVGSAYVEIEPLPHLTVRSQAGLDGGFSYDDAGRLPSHIWSAAKGGFHVHEMSRFALYNVTNTIEYKWLLADRHSIIPLVGHEYVRRDVDGFYAGGNGFKDDRLLLLGEAPGDKRFISSSASAYWFNSFFGRLEYNYDGRYFADASIRNDASSRFGRNNRNALFWSAGAMWKAKNESFLADVRWLDELTPRFSIGTSGNAEINNYEHLGTARTIANYMGEKTFGVGNSGNESLTWEKQLKVTAGVKVGLLRMLDIDLSFYRRVTTSMLMDVPTPLYLGISSITSNVGKMSNTGLDATINITPWSDRAKGDYISLYANYNYNTDRVEALWSGRDYWLMPNFSLAYAVGKPVQFFMPKFYRINPDNGLPEWYLPNKENPAIMQADPTKIVSSQEGEATDDLVQSIGVDRFPHHVGGFGLNASYYGVYLQADFAFVLDKWIVSNDAYFFNNPNIFKNSNMHRDLIDNYWTPERPNAKYPRKDVKTWIAFDDRMLSNASFMRMKNLTIGYAVPQRWLERVKHLSGAKVYCTLRNFLTVTKFEGPDPEPDTNLTLGQYPATRQVTVGVEFKLF